MSSSTSEESKPQVQTQETVLTPSQVRRQDIRQQVTSIRDHGQLVLSEGYKVLWSMIKIVSTGVTELYHVARDSGVCKRNQS